MLKEKNFIVSLELPEKAIIKDDMGHMENEFSIMEFFKMNSFVHTLNEEIPLATRVYIATVHLYMHYKRATDSILNDIPNFSTYIAARNWGWVEAPETISSPFTKEIIVELIKEFGILANSLQPGRSYPLQDWIITMREAKWFNEQETLEAIEKIKSYGF